MSIAFALRAEHRDTFAGGVLAVGDSSFDVLQELENGDGVIVVPDHDLLTTVVLDAYPPLERVDLPADADPLAKHTARELRDLADDLGIEVPATARKSELVSAVRAAQDAADAAPDPVGAGSGDGTPSTSQEN